MEQDLHFMRIPQCINFDMSFISMRFYAFYIASQYGQINCGFIFSCWFAYYWFLTSQSIWLGAFTAN